MRKLTLTFTFLAIICILISVTGCSDGNSPIRWKDAAVEEAFRSWLDIPSGDIFKSDLDDVVIVVVAARTFYINELPGAALPDIDTSNIVGKQLFVSSDITSLSDFSNCRNLKYLELKRTFLTNLNGIKNLSGLNSLTRFLLSRNMNLTDITGLSRLPNVEYLEICDMDVESFNELSKMTSLKTLSLINTNIDDFTPVGKLTQLETLYAENVPVTDLSQLKQLSNLNFLYFVGEDGVVVDKAEDIP